MVARASRLIGRSWQFRPARDALATLLACVGSQLYVGLDVAGISGAVDRVVGVRPSGNTYSPDGGMIDLSGKHR